MRPGRLGSEWCGRGDLGATPGLEAGLGQAEGGWPLAPRSRVPRGTRQPLCRHRQPIRLLGGKFLLADSLCLPARLHGNGRWAQSGGAMGGTPASGPLLQTGCFTTPAWPGLSHYPDRDAEAERG